MSWLPGAKLGTLLLAGSVGLGCPAGGRDAAPERPPESAPTPEPLSPATPPPTPTPEPTPTVRPASRPTPTAAAPAGPAPGPRSFALYALSRAKGVPPEAREALRRVRALVEADQKRGVAVKIETTRLGLEGETRLCAEYQDPRAAEKTLAQARELARGVELLNLVVEPCARRAPPAERKEE